MQCYNSKIKQGTFQLRSEVNWGPDFGNICRRSQNDRNKFADI